MLKELLITVAIIGFTASAQAATCATPPSCDSLGYKETTIKGDGWQCFACPFDPTKFACSAKDCPYGSSTSQKSVTSEDRLSSDMPSGMYRFSLHCSSGFSGDKICREKKAIYLDHKDSSFDYHIDSPIGDEEKGYLPLAQQTCNGKFDL